MRRKQKIASRRTDECEATRNFTDEDDKEQNLKRKQNSHDGKEEILQEECSVVGEGCITPYQRNKELVINPNQDSFVQADTEHDKRYSHKETTTETVENNSIRNTTTEQKALTCFTIDAILNKTDDKNDDDSAVFATNKKPIKQRGELKTRIKREILNDDTERLHKIRYSSLGTSSTSSCEENQEPPTRKHSSPASGIFLDNDVNSSIIPTSHFLWMSPLTTPFCPLYPLPFGNVPPSTGFCNVSPTSITGLSCCPSPHRNPPLGYFMFDHNKSELKPRAWEWR
ncbi:Hypothetical predicted protein [Paramuricea clavata]|nr:Hypothetical predicted protein [Paramuricea clavata]